MRRGRSSSPTSEPSACSAGPPTARRRRTASAMRSAEGRRDGGALGHDVDPALDRREEVLEAGQRGRLRLGPRGQQRAALERAGAALRARRVEARRELLERVGVDVDAAGEVGDLRDDVQPQPAGVPEQARVRELAHREVQRELVVGDLEVAAEVREVLREDRRVAVGHERDADVAAADDLLRRACRRPGRAAWRTASRRPCA